MVSKLPRIGHCVVYVDSDGKIIDAVLLGKNYSNGTWLLRASLDPLDSDPGNIKSAREDQINKAPGTWHWKE